MIVTKSKDTCEFVQEMFRQYVEKVAGQRLEDIDIYIYGVEMQTLGRIGRFIDGAFDIKLMHFDIVHAGCKFDGLVCHPPEMYRPFSDNALVLVSLLYQYEYEQIADQLVNFGIKRERIIYARDFAEALMMQTALCFGAGKMDLKVKELFDSIGKKIRDVKYIDIGANNFCAYNNTYLFYREGGQGVLVEANPDFTPILADKRPRDRLLPIGCAAIDTADSLTYYKTTRAGLNTFSRERLMGYKQRGVSVTEEITVPVRSINSILAECFPSGHIDYMSLDVEGMGEDILLALDLSRFSIDVILAELSYHASAKAREVYVKLRKQGYMMQARGIGGGGDFLFYKASVFGRV